MPVLTNNIELISDITVRLVQQGGGDHMVVAAAKVSTSGEDAMGFASPEAAEESAGLINYLVKMRHGTPFEHGFLTFFVHAPIFVFREWHRHRVGFSYNEESARYKPLDPVFWIPRKTRKAVPVEDFKPSRPEFTTPNNQQYNAMILTLERSYEFSYNCYTAMLGDGIAREVARAVLPVGIYSSCWVTCNPRSLMHFLSLRVHDETAKFVSFPQAEIQEAAIVCERMLDEGWPVTHAAFIKNGRVAP